MNDNLILTVQIEEEGLRIDTYLANSLSDFSRSKLKNMILSGDITLNGEIPKPSKVLSEGDEIVVRLQEPIYADILAEDIDFEIVYEDKDFAIINKPQGLIVHPTSSIRNGTLVNGLMKRLDNLSGINGVLRPGIVHRIDKDTSGLLVVAKNDFAHNDLSRQIQEKSCKRSYLALNEGDLKNDSGRIETYIGRNPKDRKSMAVVRDGKLAITDYTVEKRYGIATLTRFDLLTGRTHQIRVHSKYIGNPIIGDKVYGYVKQKFKLDGQLLHAEKLVLTHPTTHETMEFHAKLPEYFESVLKILDESLYT